MKEEKFISNSMRETEQLGENLAKRLSAGNMVLLIGELGAGKTAFVQGIAKGLNVKSRVISPTFVLVRHHKGKIAKKKVNLYHIDLYRLDTSRDINSLGLDDIFEDANGIFLIEWADKHESLKADQEIYIKVIGENKREVIIKENIYE